VHGAECWVRVPGAAVLVLVLRCSCWCCGARAGAAVLVRQRYLIEEANLEVAASSTVGYPRARHGGFRDGCAIGDAFSILAVLAAAMLPALRAGRLAPAQALRND